MLRATGWCSVPIATLPRRRNQDFLGYFRQGISQGRTNPAVSEPCLCLSDTRHFRRFRGFEERSSCFQWVECKFVIFAVFVKTAPSWQETKTRLPKTRFVQSQTSLSYFVVSTVFCKEFVGSARTKNPDRNPPKIQGSQFA